MYGSSKHILISHICTFSIDVVFYSTPNFERVDLDVLVSIQLEISLANFVIQVSLPVQVRVVCLIVVFIIQMLLRYLLELRLLDFLLGSCFFWGYKVGWSRAAWSLRRGK